MSQNEECQSSTAPLRLALPKGRMFAGISKLLESAGYHLPKLEGSRAYRPQIPGFETKLLKPQNAVEMMHLGSREVGFAGADWVRELGADLVELLDTELDPVRIVAATPPGLNLESSENTLIVATEYQKITQSWIEARGLNARVVRSYGATEVFPPEDADLIVDNTSTGATLKANNLTIIDELMRSSTRLYANPKALESPQRRAAIEDLVMLLRAVLEARKRVMLEMNVSADRLSELLQVLPSMRKPTVAELSGGEGLAVRAAVPRKSLPLLIPALKSKGATDIVVSALSQIVP